MNVKDGFISGSAMIWQDKKNRMTVTRGLDLYGPAMESLPASALHQIEDGWRVILRRLPAGNSLQLRYSQYADHRTPLLGYYDATRELQASELSESQRNERFNRYARADEEGLLTGARCRLFILSPVENGAVSGKTDVPYPATSQDVDVLFREIGRTARRLGGYTRELDDIDLFEEIYRSFNPGAKCSGRKFFEESFKPGDPILNACLEGDMVAVEKPVTGFYHAGQYHGCLVLAALPQNTYSGMISALTNADVDGFDFTVNLENRNVTAEIEKAEKIMAKLEQARQSGSKHARLDHDTRVAAERVQRLASGAVVPMSLQMIIHAADISQDGLREKLSALGNIVTGMGSARAYETALPTSCRNFHFAGLPGAPHREAAFWHLLDDHHAANLLPVAGYSPESLEGAEALYQG